MAKKVAKKKPARKAPRKKAKKAKAPTARRPRGKPISTAKKRKSAGRPPFEPTDEDRKRVETLVGLGLRQEEICLLVTNPTTGEPIGEKTLRRRFEHELKVGAPKANALVAESLFRRATKGEGPGAVTAAIWWSKIRMGWKERTIVEVETKSGVLIPPASMTPAEWIEAANARAVDAKEPGAEENGNGMNSGSIGNGGDTVTR